MAPRSSVPLRLLLATLVLGVLALALTASGPAASPASAADDSSSSAQAAQESTRARSARVRRERRRAARSEDVVFGIYPGGGAGAVNGRGEPRPEVPRLRSAALEELRPDDDRPFVVHLYDDFTRRSDSDEIPSWLADQIEDYTDRGLHVELVLRYRSSRGDVKGFTEFVRARVRQLGPNERVTHLQVTNEANVDASADASDGAYRGAKRALVRGIIAADSETRKRGYGHLTIGFNWAFGESSREREWFRSLRRMGGRRFSRAVDWVGINAYPGTWGPRIASSSLATGARRSTIRAMRVLRKDYLRRAGLSRAAITFAESGYPTGRGGRTERKQQQAMRAIVKAVLDHGPRYGVSGYRWFDLRDADSSVSSFESQYGIMRDDYSPKPAFRTFRALIDRYA